MTVIEAPKSVARGPQLWPLGVQAYHTLDDLGLIGGGRRVRAPGLPQRAHAAV